MLYLAWRQRFGKASPRTDLTNGRQEATKPFFKEMPPPKAASRNLLWNFLHRTTDSSSTGLSPLLQQPEGSPTTSHQNPNQQATGNQSADHTTPINKLPCIPHNSLPSEAPRCIRHRSALHQPLQRAATPHAPPCIIPVSTFCSHPHARPWAIQANLASSSCRMFGIAQQATNL